MLLNFMTKHTVQTFEPLKQAVHAFMTSSDTHFTCLLFTITCEALVGEVNLAPLPPVPLVCLNSFSLWKPPFQTHTTSIAKNSDVGPTSCFKGPVGPYNVIRLYGQSDFISEAGPFELVGEPLCRECSRFLDSEIRTVDSHFARAAIVITQPAFK